MYIPFGDLGLKLPASRLLRWRANDDHPRRQGFLQPGFDENAFDLQR